MTFTKLFSSITESTIWCEDAETRVVWITMLAMADKRGRVFGAIPGIANRARVSVEKAEEALSKFLRPDPYSRSNSYDPESQGRRIEVIEGGWRLINHSHYREIRDEEERREYLRVKQAEHRAKKRQQGQQKSTPVNSNQHNAEADTEADAKAVKSKSLGTRIPNGFVPTKEHDALAQSLGVNCDMEFQKFRDYYLGVTGPKSVKRDWNATFRNWIRNSVNYSRGRTPVDGYKSPSQLRNERFDQMAERAIREADDPEDQSGALFKRTK